MSEISETLTQASELRRQGHHQDAILLLTRSLAENPENGSLQHALSISYRLAGNFDESIRWSEAILSRQPGNPVALLARIEAVAQSGRFDVALSWLEEAVAHCPDHLPLLIRKGSLLRQAGRPAASAHHLASLASAHPANGAVLRELALSSHAAGTSSACLTACERLLQINSQDTQARLLQIASLARLQRLDAALFLLDEFTRDHPDHLPSRLHKADLLRRLGRNREAIDLLIALKSAQPDNTPVLSALAACLRTTGDHASALQLLDHILSTDPAERSALLARVEILQQLNDQPGLEAAMRSASRQLDNSVALPAQTLFASVICKGLGWIDLPIAAQLLERHADHLIAVAPSLAPQFLWAAYSVSDRFGMDVLSDPLARTLMALDEIDIATARNIVISCFRAGLRNWQVIAARLADRLPTDDRNTLLIEVKSLHDLPGGGALNQRKFPHPRPRPARVMLIVRLLKQQGRIRLAARYLGFARRVFGQDPALLQEHVLCLCGSGKADTARRILTKAEQSESMPLVWREAIAAGWAELDDPGRAVRLLDGTPFHRATRNDWYVANILAGADRDRAAQLAKDLREQTTDVHFTTSIRALFLVEVATSAAQAAGALTLPAIRHLTDWCNRSAPAIGHALDAPPPPRRIVQYWSQGRPPESVMAAVESWQRAAGFQHQLFDRTTARTFLRDRLGLDWLRAFGRAASPTEECDFFRLCHLAVEGGIYADCDDWLLADADAILGDAPVMTLYREPSGALGNNIIAAPPRHPAILWAAVAARRALLERHNENIWAKTGPGLLTRAAAWHVAKSEASGEQPALRILPRWMLGGVVQYHSPMGYKFGSGYWNRAGTAGRLRHLAVWKRALVPPPSG